MLALNVELLTGRYVATAFDDRSSPEWPPHPARVYSALVDALHLDDPIDLETAQALDWLAEQQAPWIVASEAHPRRVMTHFVPVDDVAQVTSISQSHTTNVDNAQAELDGLRATTPDPKRLAAHEKKITKATAKVAKLTEKRLGAARLAATAGSKGGTEQGASQVLPWSRLKKARAFPSVTPNDPLIQLIWSTANVPSQHVAALSRLASTVSRLGHSASLVRAQVEILSHAATTPPPGRLGAHDHGRSDAPGARQGAAPGARGPFSRGRS